MKLQNPRGEDKELKQIEKSLKQIVLFIYQPNQPNACSPTDEQTLSWRSVT
jgi:hypothetical protein